MTHPRSREFLMRFTVASIATLAFPVLLVRAVAATADARTSSSRTTSTRSWSRSTPSTPSAARRSRRTRWRSAFATPGFPRRDIFLGGPKPDKGNLVVRYHGTRRAEAAPAARAPRRRRGAQDRLVARSRSVQVHRARRLLLRPRHGRRQGDGVDLRRQPASLQAGEATSPIATSSSR